MTNPTNKSKPGDPLTARETEALGYLVHGCRLAETARLMGVTPERVSQLKRRLVVKGRLSQEMDAMAKMNPAHGIAFGKEICDIFGLDPSAIHSLRLNIEVDSIVTLEIERYVMQEEATELKRHLDRYDLVASNDARNSA